MDYLIYDILNDFVSIFNEIYCKDSDYKEDVNILGNGYCLYLAMFLKKIFKEGDIVSISGMSHYMFYYKNTYYDYKGILKPINDILYYDGKFIPISKLRICTDEDILVAECNGILDKYKSKVWKKIEPILLKRTLEKKKDLEDANEIRSR